MTPDEGEPDAGGAAVRGVSVLGIGAVGGRVAAALLDAGFPVTVWNRSPGRTGGLVDRGARAARSATGAVANPLVVLCLSDRAAVDELLDRIADHLAGRTVVVLVSGSPDDADRARRRLDDAGAAHLEAGLQATLDDIGTPAATVLCGGPRPAFDRHRPALDAIGTVRYLSADPAAVAVQDLALFGAWYDAQLACLRALDIVRNAGVDVRDFAPLLAGQLEHVVGATCGTALEIATGDHPRGPADLTEHLPVLDRLVELRRGHPLGGGGLEQARTLARRRIETGHGHEGLTSIVG